MAKKIVLCLTLALPLTFLPQAIFAVPPKSTKSKITKDKSPQSYQPYKAEVDETKPLMRVIPQRDGRFLLEPLSPKEKIDPLARPNSKLDNNKN